MKEKNWDFTFPDPFLKSMEKLNKIQLSASAMAMSDAWKAAVPSIKIDGAYTALNELIARQKEWEKLVIPTTAFSALAKDVLPVVKFDTSAFARSVLEQIDTSALTALQKSVSVGALVGKDWSWLDDEYVEDTDNDNQETPVREVSPEIRSQIAADISDVLSDPENMHTSSRNKYLDWVRERPENAMLFWQTLCQIIQTLFIVLTFAVTTWPARAVKDSQVYEEPKSTSNVVYNLTVENNVTVIGDVPYYYEVEFVNPETGEQMIGYVYKANLAAEEPEETEAQEVEEVAEAETEATEESEATAEATEPPTEVSE